MEGSSARDPGIQKSNWMRYLGAVATLTLGELDFIEKHSLEISIFCHIRP